MYIFDEYLLCLSYFNLVRFGLKILIFTLQLYCWREGCFWPPPFTPRSDRCNLSCSFLELLILTMYSSFENTTYQDQSHFLENLENCFSQKTFFKMILNSEFNWKFHAERIQH